MPSYSMTHNPPLRTWTCLTPSGPVLTARVQCQGPYGVHICANQSALVAPTTTAGSIFLTAGNGFSTDAALATLFPADVVGGVAHLWAWADETASIAVQHG